MFAHQSRLIAAGFLLCVLVSSSPLLAQTNLQVVELSLELNGMEQVILENPWSSYKRLQEMEEQLP